jgi:hypothetical protein
MKILSRRARVQVGIIDHSCAVKQHPLTFRWPFRKPPEEHRGAPGVEYTDAQCQVLLEGAKLELAAQEAQLAWLDATTVPEYL